MLDVIIQSIMNNNESIEALDKHTKRTNRLVWASIIVGSVVVYKVTKNIKIQNIQISELKKELEEKMKGE